MANEQNLKPIQKGQLSKEELKKRQINGGKKSGIAKRQKKLLKETIELMLSMEDQVTGVDNQTAITVALFKQALKGDVKAYEVIRDTVGQKPKDEVEAVVMPAINIKGI